MCPPPKCMQKQTLHTQADTLHAQADALDARCKCHFYTFCMNACMTQCVNMSVPAETARQAEPADKAPVVSLFHLTHKWALHACKINARLHGSCIECMTIAVDACTRSCVLQRCKQFSLCWISLSANAQQAMHLCPECYHENAYASQLHAWRCIQILAEFLLSYNSACLFNLLNR